MTSSLRQIEANRRNARKSTGPRTAAGKAVCARNAVKYGLRCANPALTDEDKAQRDRLIAVLRAEHQPVGPAEEAPVLHLAIALWNIERISLLEAIAYQGDSEGPGSIATVRNIHALLRYRASANQSLFAAIRELCRLQRSRQQASTQDKICTNRPNLPRLSHIQCTPASFPSPLEQPEIPSRCRRRWQTGRRKTPPVATPAALTQSRSSEYSCHMRLRRILFVSTLVSACAAAQPSLQFETKIKPILVERCLKCHSADTKMNGLDLSTRASLLKGGKQGVDVIPGDAASSRLYQFVSAGRMPPDRKLEPQEIEAVRQWISDGAVWGGSESIAAQRPRAGLDWWALQSPVKHEPPEIAGVTNPIDAFVLQKLHAKGLEFAPPADPRTLLRRISFDLHGLPPKPEDLDECTGRAARQQRKEKLGGLGRTARVRRARASD
ncbi:MAG: DUF1549 domain-containing protein, partial [Bryobacteraceae bacterium]